MTIVRMFTGMSRQRWLTKAILALVALAAYGLTKLYSPHAGVPYLLTVGMGYLSLLLTALSLIIGPLNLLVRRANPVNIDLRRDIGIWAALTAFLHVFGAFQVRMNGNIVLFFLRPSPSGYRLDFSRFGISNDLGLLATLLLIALLVTSNDLSLRKLKGKRWKLLQRFNYLLAVLAFAHTYLYQMDGFQQRPFVVATLVGVAITLILQALGIALFRWRRHRHLRPASR
jgi:sulfoxide reductase heme-binding subunit YedZ